MDSRLNSVLIACTCLLYTSGKYDRIYAGMRQGLFLCFGAAATAAAICIFGGRFIVSWFVSNPSEEIFSSAMQYLTIASWFFLPLAMIFLYRNALQGLDQGLIPMLSGVVELACRFGVIALIPASTGFFGAVSYTHLVMSPVPEHSSA